MQCFRLIMGARGTKYRERLELETTDNEIYINLNSSLCEKNPNHSDFIGVRDLGLHHLPEELRHHQVLKWLDLESERTVKVKVNKTSAARPETDIFHSFVNTKVGRSATGRAWLHGDTDIRLPCPVKNCKYKATLGEKHNVFGYVHISTNKHVVFDDFEASHTTVDFFYDTDDDRKSVVTVYGVSLNYDIEHEDQSFICCVFHEQDLPQHVETETIWQVLGEIPTEVRRNMKKHAFVISHPHGMPKKITVGEVVERYRPWERSNVLMRTIEPVYRFIMGQESGCVTRYTASTCPGSSGAPVLICVEGRFCWPITHSSHDHINLVNSSYSYFK